MVKSVAQSFYSSLFKHALLIAIAAAVLVGPTRSSMAQDSIFDLSGGLPAWRAGHAVTTSASDILPAVTDLGGLENSIPLPIPADWKIPPGYYRSTVNSYCMDLGKHAPTRGDSVGIAPILGDRAPLIHNILERAKQNPYVIQSDIQRLIWCVADGTPLGWHDSNFMESISPLLTPNELAIINMPHFGQPDADQIRSMQEMAVMNFEQQRAAAFNGVNGRGAADPRLSAAYAQLRQAGITTPDAFNSVEQRINERFYQAAQSATAPRGVWAYIGNGFYLRAFVNTYNATFLEVLKTASGKITRDDMNRITRFESGGYVIEATYGDTPATKMVDGKSVSVSIFKSIVYHDPSGRTVTIENKGWVALEPDTPASPVVPAAPAAPVHTRDPLSVGMFHDALLAAAIAAPLKPTDQWIAGNLNRLLALRNLSSNSAAIVASSDAVSLDVSNYAATTKSPEKQRLAL